MTVDEIQNVLNSISDTVEWYVDGYVLHTPYFGLMVVSKGSPRRSISMVASHDFFQSMESTFLFGDSVLAKYGNWISLPL